MTWFEDHDLQRTDTNTPREGDIVFFDWDSDGDANHVGIAEKVENGKVYTIERNSGDACKKLEYNSDASRILGCGVLTNTKNCRKQLSLRQFVSYGKLLDKKPCIFEKRILYFLSVEVIFRGYTALIFKCFGKVLRVGKTA